MQTSVYIAKQLVLSCTRLRNTNEMTGPEKLGTQHRGRLLTARLLRIVGGSLAEASGISETRNIDDLSLGVTVTWLCK
jgi:hypothetical protein